MLGVIRVQGVREEDGDTSVDHVISLSGDFYWLIFAPFLFQCRMQGDNFDLQVKEICEL